MSMDLSQATVISICPFPIKEFKPGLIPNTFEIPAVADGDIEILNIPAGIFYRQRIPVVGNIIEIPAPAVQVAESIVQDRLMGQLGTSENSKPGLFWVPGFYTKEEAKVNFKDEIYEVTRKQKKWFLDLVALADDDWNKYHQHKFISDIQRHAAHALGLIKDWSISVADASDKRCLACYSPMNPKAIICPTCKTNQDEFAKAKK